MFEIPFTLKNILRQIKIGLNGNYEKNEAESLSRYLLAHHIPTFNVKLVSDPDMIIELPTISKIESDLKELLQFKPIQYILGETEFFGLNFKVDKHVLIPRPETEELVSSILKLDLTGKSVLDIGTGSGCIAISLKKNQPSSNIHAIDISIEALKLAKENAIHNQVEVFFEQEDILNPKRKVRKFDIIVSNPPYVTNSERFFMEKNVLDFEPHSALFVKDENPLIFYKSIIEYAGFSLYENGYVFFEINEKFGREIVELLTEANYTNVRLSKDLNGKDRFISANYLNRIP